MCLKKGFQHFLCSCVRVCVRVRACMHACGCFKLIVRFQQFWQKYFLKVRDNQKLVNFHTPLLTSAYPVPSKTQTHGISIFYYFFVGSFNCVCQVVSTAQEQATHTGTTQACYHLRFIEGRQSKSPIFSRLGKH